MALGYGSPGLGFAGGFALGAAVPGAWQEQEAKALALDQAREKVAALRELGRTQDLTKLYGVDPEAAVRIQAGMEKNVSSVRTGFENLLGILQSSPFDKSVWNNVVGNLEQVPGFPKGVMPRTFNSDNEYKQYLGALQQGMLQPKLDLQREQLSNINAATLQQYQQVGRPKAEHEAQLRTDFTKNVLIPFQEQMQNAQLANAKEIAKINVDTKEAMVGAKNSAQMLGFAYKGLTDSMLRTEDTYNRLYAHILKTAEEPEVQEYLQGLLAYDKTQAMNQAINSYNARIKYMLPDRPELLEPLLEQKERPKRPVLGTKGGGRTAFVNPFADLEEATRVGAHVLPAAPGAPKKTRVKLANGKYADLTDAEMNNLGIKR